ncbi:MAG TPA: hypothetical protein VGN26_23845 [Armatimonadota bacterium]|jgi:predicted nucleotidyltransferase
MLISKDLTFAGVPAYQLRMTLRRDPLDQETFMQYHGLEPDRARALIRSLVHHGYLERVRGQKGRYATTTSGGALSLAKMRQYRRSTATRHLVDLLERAQRINESRDYLHWVERIGVFGSYLKGVDKVCDVDIAYIVTPRFRAEEDRGRRASALWDEDQAAGLPVTRGDDWFLWPLIKVSRDLKGGSPVLELHCWEETEVIGASPIILFERSMPDIAQAAALSLRSEGAA